MQRDYLVPQEAAGHLQVGQWVEIFEAYGRVEESSIRVAAMRVDGRTLVFGRKPGAERSALRPHEGRVTAVSRQAGGVAFRLHLRA